VSPAAAESYSAGEQEEIIVNVRPILRTADIDRLRDYYVAVFGATIVQHVPPDGPAFYLGLAIGDGGLGLVDDDPHAGPDSPQPVMLDVEVESVDALRSVVEDAGGRVFGAPKDMPWGMRVMHTADPDGNAVNLSQHLVDTV